MVGGQRPLLRGTHCLHPLSSLCLTPHTLSSCALRWLCVGAVRHYYDYWFHRHRLLDYKGFMSMLSSALGSEVWYHPHDPSPHMPLRGTWCTCSLVLFPPAPCPPFPPCSLFLHREMVQKVPLFRHCNADFLVGLVKALTHRIYMPGDFIVRYGEVRVE